jgi:hypothetical protein
MVWAEAVAETVNNATVMFHFMATSQFRRAVRIPKRRCKSSARGSFTTPGQAAIKNVVLLYTYLVERIYKVILGSSLILAVNVDVENKRTVINDCSAWDGGRGQDQDKRRVRQPCHEPN